MKSDFLYLPQQTVSFKAFEEEVERKKELFKEDSTHFVKTGDLLTLYASILAAKALNGSLYVCPPTLSDKQVQNLPKRTSPSLGIFTSATTGEPKITHHRWDSIESSSRFVPKALHQKTWLLSYAPWGYAGLQVFFSAWRSGGSIYDGTKEPFHEICRRMVQYDVQVVSATPTFWKMLIGSWPQNLKVSPLLQATLGGEIVDQSVIDLIETFFHPNNLTHIYASTEAGTALVVSDRRAGFPLSALEKENKNGTRLKIVEGELQVFSPVGMEQAGGWIQTGDLVQEKGGRVYFLGRKDGRINIGGRKVCPEEVEQALNSLDVVEDCLVYEKESPIVGNLIAADLVIKGPEFNPAEIKQQLKTRLEPYKIPHIIRRVDQIAISSTGKKIRKP